VWSAVVDRRADVIELVDIVGEEVRDGEAEVRWMGFFATGGARLEVELLVEVERRRSVVERVVWGGILGFIVDGRLSKDVWDRFLVREDMAEGLNGGGSFRVPFLVGRGFGGGGAKDCDVV